MLLNYDLNTYCSEEGGHTSDIYSNINVVLNEQPYVNYNIQLYMYINA